MFAPSPNTRYKLLAILLACIGVILYLYTYVVDPPVASYFALAILLTATVLAFLISPDYSVIYYLLGWVLLFLSAILSASLSITIANSFPIRMTLLICSVSAGAYALRKIWQFQSDQ